MNFYLYISLADLKWMQKKKFDPALKNWLKQGYELAWQLPLNQRFEPI